MSLLDNRWPRLCRDYSIRRQQRECFFARDGLECQFATDTSHIADTLLTGSGGANDVASAAAEVLVTVPHHPRRLVDQVEFVTSPGIRVKSIVTDRVIMTRVDDEFTVSSIFSPQEDDAADASIEKPDGFGWHGEHAQAKIMAPPTTDELELLRLFDPDGFFLK